MEEAQTRLSRTQRALDQARREREALGAPAHPQAREARIELDAAEAALAAARATLEAAEDDRAATQAAEAAARDASRKLDEQLGNLTAEARALAALVAHAKRGGFAPALDAVAPERGYERALAAALGDDLDAALDRAAPAFWGGRDAAAPVWPKGAKPLIDLVRAPAALAARLTFTAVVERADGDALQAGLPPGCRLVSKAGDLWRWDGFTARAEAPRPAAVRLEQKTRLSEVESEIEALSPKADAARAALGAVSTTLAAIEEALRAARRAAPAAEQRALAARTALERFDREAARKEAQAASLDDLVGRFETELAEHEQALAAVQAACAEPGDGYLPERLAAAREAAGPAR